jgi:predicted membrane channel-forming protein YqfA (hemolysin III family)
MREQTFNEEMANCATHGVGAVLSVAALVVLVTLADHSAIFLLIAGTYTTITLISLRGPWGWTLFVLLWGLVIIGIALTFFFRNRFRLPPK